MKEMNENLKHSLTKKCDKVQLIFAHLLSNLIINNLRKIFIVIEHLV